MKSTFPAVPVAGINAPPVGYSYPEDCRAAVCGATYSVFAGADLLAAMDASAGYKVHAGLGNPGIEALGTTTSLATLAGAITGSLSDGSTTRFDFVLDPDDAQRFAALYRLDSTDPLTAGATRIELTFSGVPLPVRKEFTFGLSVRPGAWRSAADDQAIWQIKGIDEDPGNPPLEAYVSGGAMVVTARYNLNDPPLQASNTAVELWRDDAWAENTWRAFVVQFRLGWGAADAPYVRIWVDGVQVVDYSGLFGYNTDPYAYFKCGIYHYTPPAWAAPLNRQAHAGAKSPELVLADLAAV
jgi:hypothetical protein